MASTPAASPSSDRIVWTKKKLAVTLIAAVVAALIVTVLYLNFAEPEKQIEHLIPHTHRVDTPQFRREMNALMGPNILGGNTITDLQNGTDIFDVMLTAIAQAERTITFETFVYWPGEVTARFEQALMERARAGVSVHVLVDWVGSPSADEVHLNTLREAGVDARWYRPLRWYSLGRVNKRTHRKLLVIDGQVGFIGGVGVADEWDGQAQDPDHWRDVHFRVDGPVVAQIQGAFADNWIEVAGEALTGDAYFPDLPGTGDTDAHVVISAPDGGGDRMRLMYLMALAAAEETLDIQAAYFVPDGLMIDALLAARKRGVRIRVTVPGEHIDSELVRISSKKLWGKLLEAGVEIYRYAPTMMHNKVVIVDRYFASVGSTNFDMRSFDLNDESSLNVYSPAFAGVLSGMYEADLARAEPYTLQMWRDRPFSEKFAEVILRPLKSQL